LGLTVESKNKVGCRALQTVQLNNKIAGPLMEVGEGGLRCGLVRGPGRIAFSRPVRYGAERIQYGP